MKRERLKLIDPSALFCFGFFLFFLSAFVHTFTHPKTHTGTHTPAASKSDFLLEEKWCDWGRGGLQQLISPDVPLFKSGVEESKQLSQYMRNQPHQDCCLNQQLYPSFYHTQRLGKDRKRGGGVEGEGKIEKRRWSWEVWLIRSSW